MDGEETRVRIMKDVLTPPLKADLYERSQTSLLLFPRVVGT